MDVLFEKIDLYFNSKKPSEAKIMMLVVAMLAAFLAYTFAFNPADQFFKKSQRDYQKILSEYNNEIKYANSITVGSDKQFHIKRLNQEIEQAIIDLERTTYTNGYVDNKLKELSYLLFNDKNWANFLDNIAKIAQENKIELTSITNEFKEPSLQKIEHVLTISLSLKGEYKNILKFINTIEESRLVVDLYEMDLQSGSPLEGKVKIAVWGMKY